LFQRLLLPDLPPSPGRDELLASPAGATVFHRLFLVDLLHKSLPVGDDVCEFGVAAGATSVLLAHEIRDTDRGLWLFDSFQGLSKPTEKDHLLNDIFGLGSMDRYEGWIRFSESQVRGRLKAIGFPEARTHIVPGFIEDALDRADLPARVCFAFVDFDLYSPIRTALEFLDRRLPVGGHVVVHDYGFFSSGAKTAVDEHLAAQPGRYDLALPDILDKKCAILRRVS
jgi:hypothetical protein